MELIRPGINIDFMSKKRIAMGISAILILIGVVSLFMHNGPRYGIDFSGGLLVQVRFDKATSSGEMSGLGPCSITSTLPASATSVAARSHTCARTGMARAWASWTMARTWALLRIG